MRVDSNWQLASLWVKDILARASSDLAHDWRALPNDRDEAVANLLGYLQSDSATVPN